MLILGLIKQSFISFGIWIVSGIYHIVNFAFEIFFALARGKLVDSSQYQNIVNSFYVIIGIVMLFVLAFSLLQAMVNPDDQSKGTSAIKKIIINVISSAIIVAVVPIVFNFAFDVQAAIFDQNTLGGIFGSNSEFDTESGADGTVKVQSRKLVNSVFTAFLYPDENYCNSEGLDLEACKESIKPKDKDKIKNLQLSGDATFASVSSYIADNGGFGIYTDFAGNVDDGEMEFNFIISLLAGLVLLYVGVSYCFDMAFRLVKLVFYQVIAPIPIFLRIVPTGKLNGMFNKWLTICSTVYLESFIRIIVVYFVIWIYKAINFDELFSGFSGASGFFARAFLILGLVMFMREAPKIFSEVTGLDSGNMKLGIKDKLAAGGVFTAGAIAGGAITTGIRNASNAISATRQKYYDYDAQSNKWVRKAGVNGAQVFASGFTRTLKSTTAGTISGAVRSGKAGLKAGSFSDMKNASSKGAKDAVDARLKRANYRAAHSSGETGIKGYFQDSTNVIKGHMKDTHRSVQNYISDQSIEGLTRESQNMSKLAGSYNTFNDGIESLLEKEQAKGNGSVFFDPANGFNLSYYAAFDQEAKNVAKARADFAAGKITSDQLRTAEGNYSAARDNVRDELMDMVLEGSKGNAYLNLNEKGKAALKDSLVNAENLKATVLENANSRVVQEVMGANGSLQKIANNQSLDHTSFQNGKVKLKDAAKVAQGQADIKIAEMNKENAAKGDNK